MAEAGTRLVLGRDMIFMSQQRQPLGCCDMAFGVATRKLCGELKSVATQFLVSRHGSGISVSRHNFWCRDMV